MKVFLSWSKQRSRQVAELFNGWIKCVIQSVHPWISTQDIQDGELWFPAINSQIAEISTGVIFITQENKNEPWILFEAGGLAKGLDKNRLVLLLVDLQPNDLLLSPLTAFNQTKPDKDGMRKLVGNINRWIPSPLDPATLDSVFDKFWPDFEEKFKIIIEETEPEPIPNNGNEVQPPVKDDTQALVIEVLKAVRNLEKKPRTKLTLEMLKGGPSNRPLTVNDFKDLQSIILHAAGVLNYNVLSLSLQQSDSLYIELTRNYDTGFRFTRADFSDAITDMIDNGINFS